MALGNVFIKDVDGNIPYDTGSSGEKVTGLLFDVSLQPTLFTEGYGKTNETRLKPGDVCYITSFKSAVNDFGIIERVEATDEEEMNVNFLHGIPAYHIREFFRMSGNPGGSGKLYVMFADCSANWDALEIMQRAAGGMINQIGIWTEQPLWKANGASEQYNLNLVKGLNDVAVGLAEQNQPLSLILSANPSNTGADTTEGRQIDLNKIPSCICESSRISCIFGQAHHEKISTMQMCNRNHTPVGFLGAVMGAIAKANVHESIAWVKQFNLFADDFQEIELGFGDINLDEAEENFLSLNRYESLSPSLLDELDDKGYIFPIKYAGRENGIYISKDQTCSHGGFPYHCPEPHHQQEPPCRACSPAAVCELTADGQSFNRVPRPVEDYSFQDTHRGYTGQDAGGAGNFRIRRHYRPEPERVGGRHAAHLLCPCPGGRGREDLCRGRTVINRK